MFRNTPAPHRGRSTTPSSAGDWTRSITLAIRTPRFILVGTPSGVTLAPEGGAHQSVGTTLVGMAQDNLLTFEPAFVDELAVSMRWAMEHIQKPDGTSVYLRLSTRPLEQPQRAMTPALEKDILAGGYWYREPGPDADLAIVFSGAVAPEAVEAHASPHRRHSRRGDCSRSRRPTGSIRTGAPRCGSAMPGHAGPSVTWNGCWASCRPKRRSSRSSMPIP